MSRRTTKYIKDRINNPELPQTPNWNRPRLAGTPFDSKRNSGLLKIHLLLI